MYLLSKLYTTILLLIQDVGEGALFYKVRLIYFQIGQKKHMEGLELKTCYF